MADHLIMTGWWFETWLDDGLSHHIGNVIIPTDELHLFQRGGSTTNPMS